MLGRMSRLSKKMSNLLRMVKYLLLALQVDDLRYLHVEKDSETQHRKEVIMSAKSPSRC